MFMTNSARRAPSGSRPASEPSSSVFERIGSDRGDDTSRRTPPENSVKASLETALADARVRLAEDLSIWTRVQDISTRLVHNGDVDTLLADLLHVAIGVTGADAGMLYLVDADLISTRVVAEFGITPPLTRAVEEFGQLGSQLMPVHERIVLQDVHHAEHLGSDSFVSAIDQRGFRAYQSTPLVSRHGVLLGALCTLCRRPRLVGDRDQRILDLLARQAADFIDRKQAHEQLAQSESRMRAILDGVADAIVTIDARGMIQGANPAAGRIFGYRVEELFGQSIGVLMPEEERMQFLRGVESFMRGRPSDVIGARHEVAALRKDGSTVHVELIVSEVVPKQLFTAVMRDVTERKESDARLRQSDRLSALGALAAGLGHDMNNVLLPVRAHLNVLAAGAAQLGHTECTTHINEIGKSVVYLQQLADGLHYLVTDAGHADGGEDGARLAAWWAQSGSLLSRTLPPLSKVKASIPAYLPMVRVSAHALTQAVLNLFVNAGEAITARGDGTLGEVRISATVTPDGRAVVLSVRDNGIGMSEAVRARAQDMFFTTKSRGLGTGLGLAMVSRIAKECGGSLSIASEPGKGTTMSLVLPVVEDETDTSTRIALTSDDGRAAALLQSSLRAHGFASVTIDEADDADVWVADPRTVSVADAKAWLAARTDRSLVLLGAPGTDIRNDWRGIPASVIKTDFGIDSLMAGVDRVCSIIHRRNDND